jgi:glycosyltransferase involved in cell wall biosynthesis
LYVARVARVYVYGAGGPRTVPPVPWSPHRTGRAEMPPGSGRVWHMTAAPLWSILVPTLGERRPLFERLMTGLLPQLDPYAGAVRVIGWFNNGSPPLPKIRQCMVETAGTPYVSFVDDDDLVSPDYVAEIMTALGQDPDYVGFQVQCYSDGAPIGVAYHSLEFKRWRNLPGRFERDISHLNPIRTRLALRADFSITRAGRAEDRAWADQLRRARVLQTQVVVPRILYHYLYSTSRAPGAGSRWQDPRRITRGKRAAVDSPYFTWSDRA